MNVPKTTTVQEERRRLIEYLLKHQRICSNPQLVAVFAMDGVRGEQRLLSADDLRMIADELDLMNRSKP